MANWLQQCLCKLFKSLNILIKKNLRYIGGVTTINKKKKTKLVLPIWHEYPIRKGNEIKHLNEEITSITTILQEL